MGSSKFRREMAEQEALCHLAAHLFERGGVIVNSRLQVRVLVAGGGGELTEAVVALLALLVYGARMRSGRYLGPHRID